MSEKPKNAVPAELQEGPDDGGPGQPHKEQTFGTDAERQRQAGRDGPPGQNGRGGPADE